MSDYTPNIPLFRRNRRKIGFMVLDCEKQPKTNVLKSLDFIFQGLKITGVKTFHVVLGMAFAAMLIMGVAKQEIAGVLNIC